MFYFLTGSVYLDILNSPGTDKPKFNWIPPPLSEQTQEKNIYIRVWYEPVYRPAMS